ncbi:unnamed protein product [Sphagnum jensenii]
MSATKQQDLNQEASKEFRYSKLIGLVEGYQAVTNALEHGVELLLHHKFVPMAKRSVPIPNMSVDLVIQMVVHWRDEAQREESSSSAEYDLAHLNSAKEHTW